MIDTAHYRYRECVNFMSQLGLKHRSKEGVQEKEDAGKIPLDFFLPMPSLSTTSSLHLMRRFEGSSSLFLEEPTLLLSSPLSLNMRGNWAADSSAATSRTWEPDGVVGVGVCLFRDIVHMGF